MTRNFFTPIRLFLAFAVAIEHIFYFRAGAADSPFEIGHGSLAYFAVNGFFIISGYLITASAVRSGSVAVFARSRVLRIMPALVLVTLLLGLIVAPLTTDYDLVTYYNTPETWLGILKMVTFVDPYPDWPGLMLMGSPFANDLTGPIWTLRYEVLAYIGTGLLLMMGLHRNKLLTVICAILVTSLFAFDLITGQITEMSATFGALARFGSCYLYGVAAFLYAPKAKQNWHLFLPLLLVGAVFMGSISPTGEILINLALTPTLLALAYMPVNAPKWVTNPPDLSYGLYIFHWPIYVLLTEYVIEPTESLKLFAIGVPLALLAAALSWRFVEKPSLRLKSKEAKKASAHMLSPVSAASS